MEYFLVLLSHMSAIDEYLKDATPLQKEALEKVRGLVKQLVPEVEEVISYAIPMFKYRGRPLLYFATFKDHMSLFPASDEMIQAVGGTLGDFRTSKGTLQFTTDKPIPEALLKKLIIFRRDTISN